MRGQYVSRADMLRAAAGCKGRLLRVGDDVNAGQLRLKTQRVRIPYIYNINNQQLHHIGIDKQYHHIHKEKGHKPIPIDTSLVNNNNNTSTYNKTINHNTNNIKPINKRINSSPQGHMGVNIGGGGGGSGGGGDGDDGVMMNNDIYPVSSSDSDSDSQDDNEMPTDVLMTYTIDDDSMTTSGSDSDTVIDSDNRRDNMGGQKTINSHRHQSRHHHYHHHRDKRTRNLSHQGIVSSIDDGDRVRLKRGVRPKYEYTGDPSASIRAKHIMPPRSKEARLGLIVDHTKFSVRTRSASMIILLEVRVYILRHIYTRIHTISI